MQMRGMMLFTQPSKSRSTSGEEQEITRSTQYLRRVSIQPLLEDDDELLDVAARWAEQKWGYIAAVGRERAFSFEECLHARKDLIRELMSEPHGFYMVMMDVLGVSQPVGMFSLRAWHNKHGLGFEGLSARSIPEAEEKNGNMLSAPSLTAASATSSLAFEAEEKANAIADHDASQIAAKAARLKAHLQSVMELDYVYLDENKRDLGLGGLLVRYAKEQAKLRGCQTLVLDTLNPLLNRFYKSQGAHVLLESSYHTIPTEKLSIDLSQDDAVTSSRCRRF
jgi:GNAT superfamily N-acetyltransferase